MSIPDPAAGTAILSTNAPVHRPWSAATRSASLARTIADLIGAAPSAIAPGCFAKRIETAHLAEAIHLRPAAVAGVSDLAADTLRQAGCIDGEVSLAAVRPHVRPWYA